MVRMEVTIPQILYLSMIILGAWFRILAPFIRKTFKDEHLKYDHLYTLLFIVSFVIALIASSVIYLENPLDPQSGTITLIAKGLSNGFLSQGIINLAAKWFFPEDWWNTGET